MHVHNFPRARRAHDTFLNGVMADDNWQIGTDPKGAQAPAGLLVSWLHEVDAATLRMTGQVIGGVVATNLDLLWNGPVVTLQGRTYKIYEDGKLGLLYKTCRTLKQSPGWSIEAALLFILTGAPPMPPHSTQPAQVKARRPKTLSFDHIALLQLLYMMPRASWPERLRHWDYWQRQFPDEGFTLTFRREGNDSAVPTTENQRAAWLARESKRALQRAKKLFAYMAVTA